MTRDRVRRLTVLERGKPQTDAVTIITADGWTKICRAGKAIFALPDNGRDTPKGHP